MSHVQTATAADNDHSAVCWGAIVAGAVAAFGLTLAFMALGAGVGFSMISPWSNAGVSAGTFKIASGAYLLLTAIISSAVGGYIAGRLRTRWSIQGDEVLFRDTAHGFAAWALATLVGVALIGMTTTSFLTSAATGLAQGAAQGAQTGPTDYFADTLLRPAPGARAGGTAAAPSDPAAIRREVGLILARGFASGAEFPAADRAYLSQLVSSRTGLNQADAEARVKEVLTQTKQYLDEARETAVAVALWLTVALFAGAFSASAAAIEGGQLRDGRWRAVVFAGRRKNETARS